MHLIPSRVESFARFTWGLSTSMFRGEITVGSGLGIPYPLLETYPYMSLHVGIMSIMRQSTGIMSPECRLNTGGSILTGTVLIAGLQALTARGQAGVAFCRLLLHIQNTKKNQLCLNCVFNFKREREREGWI